MTRFLTWFGTNEGRIASGIALGVEIGAALWNAHLHQPIDLASFGTALAAILTASAALLAAPPAARAMLTHQQVKLARLEKNDAE